VFKKLVLGLVLALVLVGAFFHRELRDVYAGATMFREDNLVQSFQSMYRLRPSRRIAPADAPFAWGRRPTPLPASVDILGVDRDLVAFLEERTTTSLLVIRGDDVLHEAYFLGADEDTLFASHSMGKSVVSALLGIAIDEGHVGGIQEPVTVYLPELAGSGYDGVSIKDCLQMSSGVGFDEDYSDPRSDFMRMSLHMLLGRPLIDFIASLERAEPPGTYNRYVSINTEVLGMIVARATGRGLADYVEEKLWRQIGTESEAYWILESSGAELAMGGLSVRVRDYARIARLYREGGRWNGVQVVPAAWVAASLRADEPHLRPGPNANSDSQLGYGYQWWIPDGDAGEFMALGIYGQFIYVNPELDVIVVKTSADPHFDDNDYEADMHTVEAFRAIARHVAGQGA